MTDLSPLADTLETLRVARAEIAKWTDVKNAAEERIKEALGDDTEGTIDGHAVVTWKPSAAPLVLDVKALQAQLPAEVLAPFMKPKAAARPFKVVE
jgi:hypothetical protein